MRKNLLLLSIIVFALVSLNFRCGKQEALLPKEEPMPDPVTLEMPLNIYPVKESYSVGDTIWVEANVPDKMLLNTKTKTKELADALRFHVPLKFHVVNKQVLVPAGGLCEFINPGQLQLTKDPGYYDARYNVYWNYNNVTILNYGCNESEYKFKLGFRLKAKGAFYIGLSQAALLSCNEKDPFQNKHISFKYDVQDVNLNVYYGLPLLSQNDPYRIGFDVKVLYDKKGFIVKVE